MKAARSSSWSDLQPELLGLVLRRLPSLIDRVRLRATCRTWLSSARMQSLPPPLPWLTLLDGSFLSIPGGEIIRMRTRHDYCCYGSIDNWLFLVQSDGGYSLLNPFSKAKLHVPNIATVGCNEGFNATFRRTPLYYKLVVSLPLDSSPDSFIAVLIFDDSSSTVCVCQPPVYIDLPKESNLELVHDIFDISFFDGKLYGVAFGYKLIIFEITNTGGKPKISSAECIINSMDDLDLPQPLPRDNLCRRWEYLVECCGRLLMVRRLIETPRTRPTGRDFFKHDRTTAFEVFEADLSTKPGHWRSVDKLGGQALFVGKHCSKSLPAGESSGIQEDCIYFMCDYPSASFAADPLRDSGVYNMKNGTITPLLSETATVPHHHGGQWCSTWIFLLMLCNRPILACLGLISMYS